MLQLFKNKILPVLISYTVPYDDISTNSDGWDCIKIALGSFHEYFPGEKVLVVDNDKDDKAYASKKRWLYSYPDVIVIKNPITQIPGFWDTQHPRTNHHHGQGIDQAVAYCQAHNFDFMLYFEPDCLITGTAWVEAMWQCMEQGAWMTGYNHCNHSVRVLHICPSMWKVSEPPCTLSFKRQSIVEDRQHTRFPNMTNFRKNANSWLKWDTGQKNWWIAALEGKAIRAQPKQNDFFHYGSGSGYVGMRGVRGHPDYEKFKKYLS